MARHGITAKMTFNGVHKGFKDITMDDSLGTVDVASRGFDFVRKLIGQRTLSLNSQAEVGTEAATAIISAYNAKTSGVVELYDATTIADGYGAGTKRLTCQMFVSKCSRSYPIGGEAVYDFTLEIDAENEENIQVDGTTYQMS